MSWSGKCTPPSSSAAPNTRPPGTSDPTNETPHPSLELTSNASLASTMDLPTQDVADGYFDSEEDDHSQTEEPWGRLFPLGDSFVALGKNERWWERVCDGNDACAAYRTCVATTVFWMMHLTYKPRYMVILSIAVCESGRRGRGCVLRLASLILTAWGPEKPTTLHNRGLLRKHC